MNTKHKTFENIPCCLSRYPGLRKKDDLNTTERFSEGREGKMFTVEDGENIERRSGNLNRLDH